MVLLLILFSMNIEAIDLKKNPIYAQIIKNKPNIDKKYAMKLSNIIHKVSVKYHIPPRIFAAILMQESGYRLQAKGCHRGIRKKTEAEIKWENSKNEKTHDMIESKVCTDFGISQIYFKTAKSFGFDISLLTKDLEYSVNAGAKVLSDFKKRYEYREVDYWTRYNSSSRTKRQIYKKLVERYF